MYVIVTIFLEKFYFVVIYGKDRGCTVICQGHDGQSVRMHYFELLKTKVAELFPGWGSRAEQS